MWVGGSGAIKTSTCLSTCQWVSHFNVSTLWWLYRKKTLKMLETCTQKVAVWILTYKCWRAPSCGINKNLSGLRSAPFMCFGSSSIFQYLFGYLGRCLCSFISIDTLSAWHYDSRVCSRCWSRFTSIMNSEAAELFENWYGSSCFPLTLPRNCTVFRKKHTFAFSFISHEW